MRLLIDGTVFENTNQRGIQRYFREILSRIAAAHAVDIFLSNPAAVELPANCIPIYCNERRRVRRRNVPLRAWLKLRRSFAPTRFSGHQLFHSTFFTRSPEVGIPEVVTVHDMIPEKLELKQHLLGERHIATKRACMEAAERIICISHATAADVAGIYPHLKTKLCVIHHGADHFLSGEAEDEPSTSATGPQMNHPYLLQIGDRFGYKNFDLLLSAMVETSWPRDLHLLVAGPAPTAHELEAVGRLNLQSRVKFEGPVSEKVLKESFRHAAGFVFPSLYEGFGFPLLEAQSLGTPVMCSDISIFREIAGGAAIFFDPHDPASLAMAAETLVKDGKATNREAALRNVGRFRWDECARQTAEVYERVSH